MRWNTTPRNRSRAGFARGEWNARVTTGRSGVGAFDGVRYQAGYPGSAEERDELVPAMALRQTPACLEFAETGHSGAANPGGAGRRALAGGVEGGDGRFSDAATRSNRKPAPPRAGPAGGSVGGAGAFRPPFLGPA